MAYRFKGTPPATDRKYRRWRLPARPDLPHRRTKSRWQDGNLLHLRTTRKIHYAGKKGDPRAAVILQERDLAMTFRWRSAFRLIEVGSLPDDRERTGSLQVRPPNCNPQSHLSDSSYQTMEGRRKK